jgi:hypothetical protein
VTGCSCPEDGRLEIFQGAREEEGGTLPRVNMGRTVDGP